MLRKALRKELGVCEGGNPLASVDAGHCNEHDCQHCCPHDEHDHYVCLDCGKELDPGEDIDAAELYFDTER